MPDKVYVHRTIHLGLLSGTEIPVGAPEETEYIRKDAILDIIKEQKKIAMGFSYEHLKMIEDKINSL